MILKISNTAKKYLKKLDKHNLQKIKNYLNKIASLENPRSRGKGLVGDKAGLWRYRVCDYRIICNIMDNELTILVVKIAHRKDVYK